MKQDYLLRGVGLRILKAYVSEMRSRLGSSQQVDRILLICKKNLIPFYEKAGFVLVCHSVFSAFAVCCTLMLCVQGLFWPNSGVYCVGRTAFVSLLLVFCS